MKPVLGAFITIEEGALSTLYALTSPEVEEKQLWCVTADPDLLSLDLTDWRAHRGSYLVPFAKVKATTAYGNDPKLASDLWDLCEAISAEKLGGGASTSA